MKNTDKVDLIKVLHNWTTLTEVIAELNQSEIVFLLDHERTNNKRESFIKRLAQRLNKINYDAAVANTAKAMGK